MPSGCGVTGRGRASRTLSRTVLPDTVRRGSRSCLRKRFVRWRCMSMPHRLRGKNLSEVKSAAGQVNVTRSMTLCAIGAVVGLAIAGVGLFSARGTATHNVPPEDIALVNQRPVLRSDFVTQLEGETGESFDQATRAEKLKVLDEMIHEELLVQRGLELDFAETDQMTRNALAMAMDQQALAEATTSQPSEEQLRSFFEKNPARYASDGILTARHLVLPT